jgi:hypothetical protein
LAAVLESVEPEVCQACDILAGSVDAEHPTCFFGAVWAVVVEAVVVGVDCHAQGASRLSSGGERG